MYMELGIFADPYDISEDHSVWLGDFTGSIAWKQPRGSPFISLVEKGKSYVMAAWRTTDDMSCYSRPGQSLDELDETLGKVGS